MKEVPAKEEKEAKPENVEAGEEAPEAGGRERERQGPETVDLSQACNFFNIPSQFHSGTDSSVPEWN